MSKFGFMDLVFGIHGVMGFRRGTRGGSRRGGGGAHAKEVPQICSDTLRIAPRAFKFLNLLREPPQTPPYLPPETPAASRWHFVPPVIPPKYFLFFFFFFNIFLLSIYIHVQTKYRVHKNETNYIYQD